MRDTAYMPFILLVSFDGIDTGTRDEARAKTNLSWDGKDLKALQQQLQLKRSQQKPIFTSIGTQNRPGLFMNPKT